MPTYHALKHCITSQFTNALLILMNIKRGNYKQTMKKEEKSQMYKLTVNSKNHVTAKFKTIEQ